MVWKECNRVSERKEFVLLASVEGANISQLCQRFGIARKTGYKWMQRYREEGVAGLVDRSRCPHTFRSPTSKKMESAVLSIRDQHPTWGGRKIYHRLLALGHKQVPAASTITAILKRHQRIDPEESKKRQEYQRFERSEPNELWQMDFKGEFSTLDQRWCYPLTVLDDHSRFSLVLKACGNQKGPTVQKHLRDAFRLYGLPQAMLMDNGTPWGSTVSPGSYTRFSVWLMNLDVRVIHGRPYHPQTQGKEERFHRTLKQEVLQGRHFKNHAELQKTFNRWQQVYNQERPHEALDYKTPIERYRVSSRSYPERLRQFEYDSSFEVRKVNNTGRVVFKRKKYYLSRAFRGQLVGIRSNGRDGEWDIYYRTFKVGKIELRKQRSRRKSRQR
ncbi:Integrase core domain protein [Gimesia alba]|uniref:Integrase core domain protein n=1 Tax=Gimesia alba TaxID=2527973 RepID=A0A517RFK2_9PLAN|nr:Integrase core domain protein [Gimesia alba]